MQLLLVNESAMNQLLSVQMYQQQVSLYCFICSLHTYIKYIMYLNSNLHFETARIHILARVLLNDNLLNCISLVDYPWIVHFFLL